MSEPHDPDRRRWPWIVVAALVATLGALLAPADWDLTAGARPQVEVTHRGAVLARGPLPSVAGGVFDSVRGAGFRVVQPKVRDRIERDWVHLTLYAAAPGKLPLAELQLRLLLADGSRELIPALHVDSQRGIVRFVRRPPQNAHLALGLLGLVIVLWISAVIPLFVTSLLVPVVLVAGGGMHAEHALAPFFHPIIALFFAGFLMAEAMRRSELDRRVALTIITRAGRSPATLFAAMLAVSAFLSMWMSNTAAVAVLIPVALAVTEPLAHLGYRKAMILGIAFAATTGGVGSAIGTPANPLAIEFLSAHLGRQISFVEWFAYGLPFVLLFLPLLGIYLWKRSEADVDPVRFKEARNTASRELAALGVLHTSERRVLGVFVLVILGWLTQQWHGVDTGIVALGGVVLLYVLRQVESEDLGRISWAALITFGGGLSLGTFLIDSGTSDWIATCLGGLGVLPSPISVTIVACCTLALTAVASNTATAAMLIPLAIPLASVLGTDPVLLVVVVAIASSIDYAMVIGTPPTMLAYSTRLFTTREIFRSGIILDVLGILVLVSACAALWHVLGLV